MHSSTKPASLSCGEESGGIALIHFTGFESPGTSQAPTLVTERREGEALRKAASQTCRSSAT